MTLTHATAVRNDWVDAVVDNADVGSTYAGAVLVFGTSGMVTELVRIILDAPAFGDAAAGTATAAGLPLEGTATATGIAAEFELWDRDGTKLFEGSVTGTGGGGDFELTNVNITTSDVIRLSALTYTAGA